jgi:diguanylate cyclase (GGDEF)-like protein/PAS domain S-box-containing protein
MSVRKKTFIIICLTFLALLGIFYFISQWFLINNAIVAEDKNAARDVTRLQEALDNQITDMNATVSDWAPWDDTYEFISSGDTGYINSNLPNNEAFTNIGVELMVFINNSGQIVYGKMVDLESKAEIPIPKSLDSQLQVGSLLLSHKSPSDNLAGILNLPEGPMIIASQPIVTSQGYGPIRGTLIMGRRLNEAEIAVLSQRTQLSISVFPFTDSILPEDVSQARKSLVGGKSIFIAPQSATVVSGYLLVNDVYGKPVLILRVDSPRDLLAQANLSIHALGLAMLAIGISLGLALMLNLDRMVITRLTKLDSSVLKIAGQGNASSRVEAEGNDEIFRLASSVNSMLDSLEKSQAKERVSEERFRSLYENATIGIYRTSPNGHILMANPALSQRNLTEEGYDPKYPRLEFKERIERDGEVRGLESAWECKNGSIIYVRESAHLVRNEKNMPIYYEGTVEDITERRHTQTLQEAIYRIAAATETTRSLDELFHQIHQIISSVMPAENFYITLYDEAQNLLRFPYFKDAEDEPYVGGVQPGKGLTAYVLRTGKSLLCTQAVHDELERQGEVKLLGMPSAIWLGVPLVVEGKTTGAMVVQHYTDPQAYGEREQHMLEFVSTQVANAINRKRAEEALRQSEAELRALFASMHDVVLVIDRFGVYLKIAPTDPELLIIPPEELLGKNMRDIFQPDQAEAFLYAMKKVLETKQTEQIEYALLIGDRIVWFAASISPMTEDSTLWVAHDITERKRFELVQNALYRITQTAITSEGIDALYRSIHSILGELIPAENFFIALIEPISGLISFPYYIDQYDPAPVAPTPQQGLTGYVIRTGRPLLATRQVFDRLVQQGDVEPIGTFGVDWMGAPLKVGDRLIGVMAVQIYTEGIHFAQKDLDLLEFVSTQVAQAIERKRMEDEIRNLSLTDALTGLNNRRGFTLLAEQEVKLAHRINRTMLLFFCDVDDLKGINDTHGHSQGDLALQEASAILKETFREADILARLGGDEFVVLAVDASLESAESMTNRIQVALERRNQKGERPYQLTLSMGVARCDPEVPSTVSELIVQADALMYDQKQARKA